MAQEQSAPPAADASLLIYPASRLVRTWRGDGKLEMATDLCVASTSGRFRVLLAPLRGAFAEADLRGASATLTTDAGTFETRELRSGEPLDFSGRNRPESVGCTSGPNARLILTLPQEALTAAKAGSLSDTLQLTVIPG